MAGGPGKIADYNKSISPEQRKKNASKAGASPKKNARRNADIRKIANLINEAPAGDDLLQGLAMLNIQDENVSNAAGIALAVFQAAINGDMKAVEKWEKYVGQSDDVLPQDKLQEDALSKNLREFAEGLESDGD